MHVLAVLCIYGLFYVSVVCTMYLLVLSLLDAGLPFTYMPDGWLEVSNWKVLLPAIPTQVFLGFFWVLEQMLGWFPFSVPVATTCFPCNPPLTKPRVIYLHSTCICNM